MVEKVPFQSHFQQLQNSKYCCVDTAIYLLQTCKLLGIITFKFGMFKLVLELFIQCLDINFLVLR